MRPRTHPGHCPVRTPVPLLLSMSFLICVSGCGDREKPAKELTDGDRIKALEDEVRAHRQTIEELAAQNGATQQSAVETIRELQKQLWLTQKQWIAWHPAISAALAEVPYRGEIRNKDVRAWWRETYFRDLERIKALLEPYDASTKKGKIIVHQGSIPQVPRERWEWICPTSKEMWDTQEDIWVLTSLISAIASVNEDASSLSEAPIRELREISLTVADPPTKHEGQAGPARTMGQPEGIGDLREAI